MKTTKTVVILLLALVLLTVAANHSVVAMVEPDISNTLTASCLVKITADESVLLLNEFTVDYLLRSSGVAGKSAREVLGISPDVASELFEIEEIFGVDSPLGGMGLGGYGGGMGLPADATPGASTPGASTLGTTPASRSAGPTTPTPTSRSPSRTTTLLMPYPTTPTTNPTRPTPALTQPLSSTTEQTILFRLKVMLPNDAKPAAEEFMMALVDNLRSAFRGAFDEYRSKLDNQLMFADKEAIRAEKRLVEMQAKLREISDSRDLSRNVILSDISGLRQKLQTAIMKRASDETLYEATTIQIAEEQVRRKKLVEDDPIAREFKSILDLHEKRLKDTQKLYDTGGASAAELEDIKEKIIRARIELAKRQEEVSNPPGSLAIDATNEELAKLSTKIALAKQEISAFQEQFSVAQELLRKADDYELLSLKAGIARQNLEETLLWHARLGRNARSIQPPDVTVIGAE